MPAPLLVPLVLASALLHALWNALVKRERDAQAAAVGVLGVAAVISSTFALVRGGGLGTLEGHGWTLLAGLSEAGYFFALGSALRRAPFGRVYAVTRGALLCVWPLSLFWMGEHPNPLSLVGAGLVMLGLLCSGGMIWEEGFATARRWLSYAALASICIASYHLSYKRGLAEGAEPTALFAASLVVALPLNLLFLGQSRSALHEAIKQRPWTLILAGTLCFVSFWAFLTGLAHAGAGWLLTLRNTSVLFAQGLSFFWLGEKPRAPQLWGVALVTLGAIFLSWPK